MAFYRTQTITHKFTMNIREEVIDDFIVTYVQNDEQVINIEMSGLGENVAELSGNAILVHLSQEDTALFVDGIVKVQIKVWTKNRQSVISKSFLTECKDVLNEKVFV